MKEESNNKYINQLEKLRRAQRIIECYTNKRPIEELNREDYNLLYVLACCLANKTQELTADEIQELNKVFEGILQFSVDPHVTC